MSATYANTGRLRFRHNSLKVGSAAFDVRDKLLNIKGVIEVEINKRVGSLLVTFDKVKTNVQIVLEAIARAIGLPVDRVQAGLANTQKALTTKKARSLTKKGLMLSGGVAIGALPFSEKVHVIGGVAWLGFMGLHVFQNRKTLFK